MSHVIIGTAGHIDHGKSSLVRALTGMDPDRLKEEKERGMTIDLGFAFYGQNAAFIDVPGHERFIKNMVAGVSTIDLVLFVVAADDGVMPQTREHLDILTLLGLKRGIIVINKIDVTEPDWIDLVELDLKELCRNTFLQNSPILRVSALTGTGIEELKKELDRLIIETRPRLDRGYFWLPIDRVFTMKGFGTVVTGSVLSGAAAIGDQLTVMPGGLSVRVRGLQTHGQAVARIQIGDRAALNLVGLEKQQAQRGDILTTPGQFQPTERLDCKLELLNTAKKPLKNRARVRCHIGTSEVLGRVLLLDRETLNPGDRGYAQLLLEAPIVANRLDPFVIRSYSPLLTIGGGIILDTAAAKHRRQNPVVLQQLQAMEKEEPQEVVLSRLTTTGYQPVSIKDLARTTGIQEEGLEPIVQKLIQENKVLQLGSSKKAVYVSQGVVRRLETAIQQILQEFHQKEPWRPGLSKGDLINRLKPVPDRKLAEFILERLMQKGIMTDIGGLCKLADHKIRLTESEESLRQQLLSILQTEAFATSGLEELVQKTGDSSNRVQKVLGAMQGMHDVILNDDIYFTGDRLEEAKNKIRQFFETHDEMSISEFRQMLNTSRKYAFALINYLDGIGFTERWGDNRRIKAD